MSGDDVPALTLRPGARLVVAVKRDDGSTVIYRVVATRLGTLLTSFVRSVSARTAV